jgi:acyl-CoA thioester hydrolase
MSGHVSMSPVQRRLEIHRGKQRIIGAKVRYVFVDPATLRRTAPPEQVREAYTARLPT